LLGTSLLEFLVATALTMTLSVIILHTVHTFAASRVAESDLYERTHALLLIQAIVSRAAEHTDSSRLPLPPLIHSGGAITYADGTPVTELLESSTYPPHPDSHALSSISLNISALMRLALCHTDGTQLSGQACIVAGRPPTISRVHNIALISADGVRIIAGRIHGRGLCRRVHASLSNSLYDSKPGAALSCNTLAIVPVNSLETIYLSTDYRLRLARYSGARVIENQPLASILPHQLPALQFSLHSDAARYQLRAELLLRRTGEYKSAGVVTSTTVLARQSPLGLLMNLGN
jgi:hypothetical protein